MEMDQPSPASNSLAFLVGYYAPPILLALCVVLIAKRCARLLAVRTWLL